MLVDKLAAAEFFSMASALFATSLEELPREADILTTEIPLSGKSTWKTAMGDQFPSMELWKDEKTFEDMGGSVYEISPKPYTSGIRVDRHQIEDCSDVAEAVMGVSHLIREEGVAANHWYDSRRFAALKAGDSTKGPDDVNFFSTTHKLKDGSNQSNKLGSSGDKWWVADLSRGVKPVIDVVREAPHQVNMYESIENFMRRWWYMSLEARGQTGYGFYQTVVQNQGDIDETKFRATRLALRQMKNARGRPLVMKATHLICGASQEDNARDLLYAKTLASGEDNIEWNNVQLVVSPFLD